MVGATSKSEIVMVESHISMVAVTNPNISNSGWFFEVNQPFLNTPKSIVGQVPLAVFVQSTRTQMITLPQRQTRAEGVKNADINMVISGP